jgi:multimeric flavodoxin WrbA
LSVPKALLLIGSPRGFSSTSNSLGSYLLEQLQNGGYGVEKVHVQTALRSKDKELEMLRQVANSDVVVLAFPLYVDSLPAALILALEKIADYRKTTTTASVKQTRFLVIVNNGFPESAQNATALAICQQFAKETGLIWAGGLSLGGGGVINGAPLEKAPMCKNIRKALDLAADNLLHNQALSEEAAELMAKPVMPRAIYIFFSNRGWKSMAKKYGAQKKLRDTL